MAQLASAGEFGKISSGEWVIKEEKHDCDNYLYWAVRLMQQLTAVNNGRLQTEDPWNGDNNYNLDKSGNEGRWLCCGVQFYPWFKLFPFV